MICLFVFGIYFFDCYFNHYYLILTFRLLLFFGDNRLRHRKEHMLGHTSNCWIWRKLPSSRESNNTLAGAKMYSTRVHLSWPTGEVLCRGLANTPIYLQKKIGKKRMEIPCFLLKLSFPASEGTRLMSLTSLVASSSSFSYSVVALIKIQ